MPAGDKFMALMSKQPKSDTSFDKTFMGYIAESNFTEEDLKNNSNNQGNENQENKEELDYNYKVSVNGNIYSTYCYGVKLLKGERVPVVVPCNNWSKLYIDMTPSANTMPNIKLEAGENIIITETFDEKTNTKIYTISSTSKGGGMAGNGGDLFKVADYQKLTTNSPDLIVPQPTE